MNLPLMPKATATWLIDNTSLTFERIAQFCGLHYLEVRAIADQEGGVPLIGFDPVVNGQLTREEIARCERDSSASLTLAPQVRRFFEQTKKQKARYTPVARRQEKPDAIAWLIKNYPKMTDAQIVKLIGTTKNTVQSIRNKTHWNSAHLKPRDPVLLGICSQVQLDFLVEKLEQEDKRSSHEDQ